MNSLAWEGGAAEQALRTTCKYTCGASVECALCGLGWSWVLCLWCRDEWDLFQNGTIMGWTQQELNAYLTQYFSPWTPTLGTQLSALVGVCTLRPPHLLPSFVTTHTRRCRELGPSLLNSAAMACYVDYVLLTESLPPCPMMIALSVLLCVRDPTACPAGRVLCGRTPLCSTPPPIQARITMT
jgi:hypothetical protein